MNGMPAALERDANLVLVGFMGTGKSAVGRRAARRLGRMLVDMDALIEKRAGRSIPEIFRDSGEPCFRALEREAVRDLAAQRGLVIAAGGGVVLNPENPADLARTGVVVCLWADPDEILRRVGGDEHRPLLQAPDRRERIAKLLEQRRPLYEAIPDRVDTTGRTADEVTEEVLRIFERRTSNTEHRTPNTERPTSNIQHPTNPEP